MNNQLEILKELALEMACLPYPYLYKLQDDFGSNIAVYGFVSLPKRIDAIIKVNEEGQKIEIKMTHFLPQKKIDFKYTSDINIKSDSFWELKDKLNSLAFEKSYLFSWDNVPGDDSERLLRFLRDNLKIEWAENAKILKFDDCKTIRVVKDENAAEINIDDKNENATLKIRDAEKTHDLKVKMEDGKLNIYEKSLKEEERIKTELHGLYTSLIGGEIREFLETNYEKIKTIWIDCNIEEINPFWELLYVTLPNNSFFWGDQFAIARVPTYYKKGGSEKDIPRREIYKNIHDLGMKLRQCGPQLRPEVEISVNGKVKIGLIKMGETESMKAEKKYFKENNLFKVIEIIESASDISKLDRKVFDILHFIAHYEGGNVESHDGIINFGILNMRTPDCVHIVFFNVCGSEVMFPSKFCKQQKLANQDCFKNKKAWIGTHLNVGEKSACNFVENFYNQFLSGDSIANSAKEARKKNNNIMRLFYTVYGWPFMKLV
jgi:hypothetical protein